MQAVQQTNAADFAKREAVGQPNIAMSRELAASDISQLSIDPELSVPLGLEALQNTPTSEAEDSLRQSLFVSAVRTTLRGHANAVGGAAFSQDGQRVLTSSLDGTARVWDAQTGAEVLQLVHTNEVNSAAFSPDGRRAVTSSLDGTIRVWDAHTGQQLLQMRGHTARAYGVEFNQDGQRVVFAGSDGTARLWDAQTGEEFVTLDGHAQPVLQCEVQSGRPASGHR